MELKVNEYKILNIILIFTHEAFLYNPGSDHIMWQNMSYHDQDIQLTLNPALVFD